MVAETTIPAANDHRFAPSRGAEVWRHRKLLLVPGGVVIFEPPDGCAVDLHANLAAGDDQRGLHSIVDARGRPLSLVELQCSVPGSRAAGSDFIAALFHRLAVKLAVDAAAMDAGINAAFASGIFSMASWIRFAMLIFSFHR